MDDLHIYKEIVSLQDAGVPAALATVVESAGSAPRKAGAKMIVLSDGTTKGTVGGGKVELETILAAQDVITSGCCRTIDFPLTEEFGHVCGGRLLVFVEPVVSEPRLVVIGAGHVGKAVALCAAFAGFHVTLADDRPGCLDNNQLPGAVQTFAGDAAAALTTIPVGPDTSVVIATSSFEKDFEAVRVALKTPIRYIGVIGSARKKSILEQTLGDEGYTPPELRRVIIPVGLAIGAETPQEIAISIVSELVQKRRSHAAVRAGDTSGRGDVPPDGVSEAVVAAG